MFKRFKYLDEESKSRSFFIVEGIAGVSQYVLTSGAFLVGFASLLGASDELNGIITVVPAVTGIMQIFSSLFFERIEKRKKQIITIDVVFRILLSTIYFIPILLFKSGYSLTIFISLYIMSHFLSAFLSPALSNWQITLTPITMRGRYFATKDKIALLVSAVLTILLGKVLDWAKLNGDEFAGFKIIGVILLVLALINIFSLFKISEPEGKNTQNRYNLKDVFTVPLKSPSFKRVILLFILWNVALQIGGPYISVYMVTHLKLSYTYMMTLSVIATVVRVLFANYWGKLADRNSWFLSTKVSIFILAITHFSWVFVTPSNYFILVPILHITSGFAWSGINISLFNIQFLFAKREGRTMYIGLNAALGGLFSFLSASLGGKIISTFKDYSIDIFQMNWGSMQIVFLLSGILLSLCPLFVKYFIEKAEYEIELD